MRASLLLLAFALLSGCSGRTAEIVRLDTPETARLGGDLPVTTGDLDRPYDEVALLRVGSRDGDDATEDLLNDLRIAARRADADAVVRVDFEAFGNGESGSLLWYATGTAVRFR